MPVFAAPTPWGDGPGGAGGGALRAERRRLRPGHAGRRSCGWTCSFPIRRRSAPAAVADEAVAVPRRAVAAATLAPDPALGRLERIGPAGLWYACLLIWGWLLLLFAARRPGAGGRGPVAGGRPAPGPAGLPAPPAGLGAAGAAGWHADRRPPRRPARCPRRAGRAGAGDGRPGRRSGRGLPRRRPRPAPASGWPAWRRSTPPWPPAAPPGGVWVAPGARLRRLRRPRRRPGAGARPRRPDSAHGARSRRPLAPQAPEAPAEPPPASGRPRCSAPEEAGGEAPRTSSTPI